MEEQKKPRFNAAMPLAISIALIAGLVLARFIEPSGSARVSNKQGGSSKIDHILNYIESRFVDSISRAGMEEKLMHSLFEQLDPHSGYIPAEDFQDIDDPLQGEFEGIGVQFNIRQDTVMVVQVISGGPSEKVRIKAGDRIVAVDDSLIAGIGIKSRDVVRLLKGPKGTKVKLGIARNGNKQIADYVITRDRIPFSSIDIAYMPQPGVGYVKISRFAATTYGEFEQQAGKLKAEGMEYLVLDLRGNGGGYLNAAASLMNEFLEAGQTIVFTEGRADPRKYFRSDSRGGFKHTKLAVLIDEGSASASEIIAGAVQDSDRGLVIGRRSFGKGLVMEQVPLPDGSAIRLTISRYYTPSGRSIQKPYDNGNDAYFREIEERFANGGLLGPDSASASIAYYTSSGRTVYGGGGIMPDIFVSLDTAENTALVRNIAAKGLIYDFCIGYADKNRDKLSSVNAGSGLDAHVKNNNVFDEFISFAAKSGISAEPNEIKASEPFITHHITAQIARNIHDDKGFFPIWLRRDPVFQAAIKAINEKHPLLGM
jgi:carboxyl-terminal processing protease